MPIRSGAMQRPSGCRCGNTLRQRYDEVGLPCSSTMGSPCPTSTYAISRPRTRRRCFWYGNAAEIMFASPIVQSGTATPRVTKPSQPAPLHCAVHDDLSRTLHHSLARDRCGLANLAQLVKRLRRGVP